MKKKDPRLARAGVSGYNKPNITTQERKDILQKILLLKNMSSPTPKVIKQIQQLQQQL